MSLPLRRQHRDAPSCHDVFRATVLSLCPTRQNPANVRQRICGPSLTRMWSHLSPKGRRVHHPAVGRPCGWSAEWIHLRSHGCRKHRHWQRKWKALLHRFCVAEDPSNVRRHQLPPKPEGSRVGWGAEDVSHGVAVCHGAPSVTSVDAVSGGPDIETGSHKTLKASVTGLQPDSHAPRAHSTELLWVLGLWHQ